MAYLNTDYPAQKGVTSSYPLTAGTPKYYRLGDPTVTAVSTEDMTVDTMVLVPTVISSLWGRLNAAPGTSESVVVTLYVNGIASALTMTFGATDTAKSDVDHVVTLAPGDYYCLYASETGAGSATNLQAGALVTIV